MIFQSTPAQRERPNVLDREWDCRSPRRRLCTRLEIAPYRIKISDEANPARNPEPGGTEPYRIRSAVLIFF